MNDAAYLAALELLDGAEVMANLYERLGRVAGEATRGEVFQDVPLPPLGTPNAEKARLMQIVIKRLERTLGTQACRALLADSLRDLPEAHYLENKHQYEACGSVDAFLAHKRGAFITQLEQIRDEGGLFFDQPVTDAVVAFVRENPEVSVGVREGSVLEIVKIPYRADAYLAEPDEDRKRYLYCHCPWARESLVDGRTPVSATFCQCSAGFSKRPWEVILGEPLSAEVLASVLQGDLVCRFAIHLPPAVVGA